MPVMEDRLHWKDTNNAVNHTELDYNVKVKFTEHKGKEI